MVARGEVNAFPFTTAIFFGPCNWVLIPFQVHLHTHLVAQLLHRAHKLQEMRRRTSYSDQSTGSSNEGSEFELWRGQENFLLCTPSRQTPILKGDGWLQGFEAEVSVKINSTDVLHHTQQHIQSSASQYGYMWVCVNVWVFVNVWVYANVWVCVHVGFLTIVWVFW